MPIRAPRICGCGLKIASGEQCACERRRSADRKARADAGRPTARERGYDTKWERERAAFLKTHPHCERIVDGQRCGKSATVVHHIVPHKGDRSLFWSRSNWSPRCKACHDGAEQSRERRGRGVVTDFRQGTRTGGGRNARDRSEMGIRNSNDRRGTHQ